MKHIRTFLAMKAEEVVVQYEEPKKGHIPVPTSYKQAINDPIHGKDWLQATLNEISALQANNTYRIETPPAQANIVGCKWVFAVKHRDDGTVNFNARLVARGFSQIQGIDFEDTFAPTVRMDTMRVMLALIAIHDWEAHQIDINNAFTEATLDWTIYMKAPPGIEVNDGEHLRLLQSLYGLKQAARDWYQTCDEELKKLNFTVSDSDPCMYFHKARGMFLLVYVDDITIVSESLEHIEWFKLEFKKRFKLKDLGNLKKILGVEIQRDRSKRTITVGQPTYTRKLLKGLNMEQDKHRSASVPMNGYDAIRPASATDKRVDKTEYQRVIGLLMHLMVYTRPDIAFALSKLSQFMSYPAEHHAQGAKALLRYVRSTADMKVTYGAQAATLVGFSDADYAADKTDRKSTLGQVFMFAGGPISWASRKQKSVATSTTEAEYMALSECSRQAIWLAQLLKELGHPEHINESLQVDLRSLKTGQTCVELRGDNMGSIKLVKNAQVGERSKHIDVAYHYIRELQKKKRVNVTYTPTDRMTADGLTKPLERIKFALFLELLGMTPCSTRGNIAHQGEQ